MTIRSKNVLIAPNMRGRSMAYPRGSGQWVSIRRKPGFVMPLGMQSLVVKQKPNTDQLGNDDEHG
jgi:hypothetical protein